MARLFVVSDIHGYLDDFRSCLRGAELIGDDDTWTGGSIEFNNKAVNQDACQGATVTINYVSN